VIQGPLSSNVVSNYFSRAVAFNILPSLYMVGSSNLDMWVTSPWSSFAK